MKSIPPEVYEQWDKFEDDSKDAYVVKRNPDLIPIEVLQEIKQDIDEWYQFPQSSLNWLCYTKLCEIFDKHINNRQFERIWQNTVEEMKRRKIGECPKDCLSCSNSFSEPSDNGEDILHCMEKDGEVVPEDGYCEKYN